jgi:hypothetical protein
MCLADRKRKQKQKHRCKNKKTVGSGWIPGQGIKLRKFVEYLLRLGFEIDGKLIQLVHIFLNTQN